MTNANFAQYLSVLAILWGGLLLLTRIKRELHTTKIPHLIFVLNFLCKVLRWFAILATGVVLMFLFDIKGALSLVRQSLSAEIEFFLRECIDLVFHTRSFFAVFNLVANGVIVFSTAFCSVAVFLGKLAYLCLVLITRAGHATKIIPTQQYPVQTFTTNAYNFQRKYFIRA